MKIIIFVGPTLHVGEARAELDATYRPPASQGDILSATLESPWAIGIVDGYFERMPSVWHKEILWALSQGIHVFGSASMGALRAAELEQFGMVGVGRIFENFLTGKLEADDEVAVAHSIADSRYFPASEALVNIRASLHAALQAGIIHSSTLETLINIGIQLYYPKRSFTAIISTARNVPGVQAQDLERLEAWLPTGKIDQKRRDAISMLRLIKSRRERSSSPKRVQFTFQHTDAWSELCRQVQRRPVGNDTDAHNGSCPSWYEELQLEGEHVFTLKHESAWSRALALELLRLQGQTTVDQALVPEAIAAFCRARGFEKPEDLEYWLKNSGLDLVDFNTLMEDDIRAQRARLLYEDSYRKTFLDQQLLSHEYLRHKKRAHAKRHTLESAGFSNPTLGMTNLEEEELWNWYFVEKLGQTIPKDLEEYAKRLNFLTLDELRGAIVREYLFSLHYE